MNKKLIAKRPFEFSARVTLALGRESISSSTAAISELVKNSYDADSESVRIKFILKKYTTSSLIIEDDGWGMEADDILSHWLRVGTENKKSVELSKSGNRILTGAKGLGRLGIDRLCKKLVLYTKTKGSDKATQLIINWKEYEKADKNISDIEHEIYEVELPIDDKYGQIFRNQSDHGTRLLLIGLKDNWNSKFLSELENDLRLLVSPFRSKNDFSITIETIFNDEKTKNVLDSASLLEISRWSVWSNISENSIVSLTLKKGDGEKIEREYNWSEWIQNEDTKHTFGPASFNFYYVPQDNEKLNKVNFRRSDFQQFMRLNRGVRIYRDDFRVRPYGEPTGKGDWLDLGYRKASSPGGIAQGGWRIAPNQILGAVDISRMYNSALNDQANREGILQNSAFLSLRAFIIRVISEFEEIAHLDAAKEKSEVDSDYLGDVHTETTKSFQTASSDLNRSLSSLGETEISKEKKKIIKKQLADFEKARKRREKAERQYHESLRREKELLESQKNTLSNLASLGILTVCFGHEIRQHTSQALTCSLQISDVIEDSRDHPLIPMDFEDCLAITESIQRNIAYIEKFSSLALSNIRPDKRKRKKVNIPSVFRYVFDLMSESFNAMHIEYRVISDDINESQFNAVAFEIDWESIAINLITNSMWAMENISSRERIIEVEFSQKDNDFLDIYFRDSGVGLESGSEETIFLPMKSGKTDRSGNVIGTGMGLSIVKSHIENHSDARLLALTNGKLGGAEFQFKIPRARI